MTRTPDRLPHREQLLFEAGIKLGGAFHQYIGMPVSARTSAALARAIGSAIELQPYVVRARVRIDPSRGAPPGRGRFAYRYLTPEMLRVDVELASGSERIHAKLEYRSDLRYPLMSVAPTRKRRSPRRTSPIARRSGRRPGGRGRRTAPWGG